MKNFFTYDTCFLFGFLRIPSFSSRWMSAPSKQERKRNVGLWAGGRHSIGRGLTLTFFRLVRD